MVNQLYITISTGQLALSQPQYFGQHS